MQSVARWLAVLAISLQVAWPLLVNARPRAVVLVPLCTVDGVTHFIEQPNGKTPLEECDSHGKHCPLCFFGERFACAPDARASQPAGRHAQALAAGRAPAVLSSPLGVHGARAPPLSRVVAASNDNE